MSSVRAAPPPLSVAAAVPFANIASLGRGDPGLRADVFTVDCDGCYAQNKSVLGRWKVPDGVSVRPDPQCSYDTRYSEIHSTWDWVQHLSYYTKKRTTFDQVERLTSDSAHVLTKAKALCVSYSAALSGYEPAAQRCCERGTLARRLSPGFVASLLDFVTTYGTHHISEVWMGGSFVQTSVFDRDSFAALKREHSNLDPAKYGAMMSSFETFGAGLWVSRSHNAAAYANFTRLRQSTETSWIPARPPDGDDVATSAQAWLDQVRDDPAVVAYDLANLTSLFAADLLPA
eukprot:gene24403-32289_t